MAPVARHSTFSRAIKPYLQIKPGFRPRSAPGDNGVEKFLDRWSPKLDHDHYDRVRLYRRRKETVARHQKQQEHRRRTYISAAQSESETTVSPTDISQSSLAFSNLGSEFQDELDDYDEQIKTLQQGQWPTPPQPKTTLRIGGHDPQKRAKELKEWGFVQGMMYGGNSATLRDSDRVHPASSYKIGVIFSAPHHTAGSSESWVSINDPYQTATPFGVVYSKFRKMVVIKVFGEHVISVPIYSHNGKGLEGKAFVKEYVSIRDIADRTPLPPEGIHYKLLAIANPDFLGRVVSGKSTVKLTEFCSHRYTSPATIEGELESNSTKRLLGLVNLVGE
ncbi:hypothetical protein GGR51DRAFT_561371 [Nemania sp. FL0031]|nr:hypothetical protein GGR51DRAFT_561371 [Nemania sp. FL0031]